MSVVSDRHNVVPFVAGKSQAFPEQRLARVGYKTTAKQKAKFPSVCASVPMIQDQEIVDRINDLVPYVRTMLEETQDKVFRSLYESSDGSLTSIADSEISVNACIAWLEMESTGGRLTKEAVEKWFDSELQDNLVVLIAEKLKFDDPNEEQMVTINKHIKGYREVISSLSGGKTFLQPNQIKGVRTALALCDDDSEMVKKLTSRLDSMEKQPKIEDLLEL